jgi:quercetin dioxygenase-like cupin family protein
MAVAVDTGTVSRSSLAFERLTVSRVVFPAAKRLGRHAHAQACTAVIVDGAVRKRFTRDEHDAVAGALVTMPPEEPHADEFGTAGATIVVVEERVERAPATCRLDWEAMRIACRIERELAAPDAYTPLAVEGLALELMAVAARQLGASDRPVVAIAADAGFADQSHFTRAFKERFGITPARYRAAVR